MKTSLRFKLKLLSTAILLAAGAGAAQAAINPSAIAGVGTGSGELFLNVWDQAASTSYSLDLGLTVDAILANPTAPQTWTLDTRFQNFASTGDPLTFNIAGSNAYPGLVDGDGNYNSNYGAIISHTVGKSTAHSAVANNSIGQLVNAVGGRAGSLNAAQVAQNPPSATLGDYTQNLSEVSIPSTPQGSYFTNFWGTNQSKAPWSFASATVRSTTALDQTLELYFEHADPNGVIALIEPVGAGFKFTLNANAGTLTWASSTPVPLPASVWLFFSALAGLGFFKRRDRS